MDVNDIERKYVLEQYNKLMTKEGHLIARMTTSYLPPECYLSPDGYLPPEGNHPN